MSQSNPNDGGIKLPARVIVSLRAGAILAVANIICVLIFSSTWTHVKAEPKVVTVTGSAKKQITKSYGYDGGPVFSRDGKKIAWRAGHPSTPETKKKYADLLHEDLTSPMKMELFVADADGKNVKQITNFGCASFAPTFTPDGKQLLFASNKHACDSSKFELYLINVDGTGLKQVTDYGGFTSFPEYSPDGKKLVFVSDWKAPAKYEFNVFTADWKY